MLVYKVTGNARFKNSQVNSVNYCKEAVDGNSAVKKVKDFLNKNNDLSDFELNSVNPVGEYLPN